MSTSTIKLMKFKVPQVLRKFVTKAFAPKYLIFTNVAISTTSSGLGDVLEQSYEIFESRLQEWNKTRTRNMMLAGITVGIFCHAYYNFLDKYLPGHTVRIVLKKIVIDQFICSPLTIGTLFVTLAVIENKSLKDLANDLKQKGSYLYAAEWIVWPPAQFVNFYFLPTKYRVLYDSTISFLYDVYTSYVANYKENENED